MTDDGWNFDIKQAPRDGTKILVYRSNVATRRTDLCRIAWWSNGNWKTHMAGYYLFDSDIVAWQSLPPPPPQRRAQGR